MLKKYELKDVNCFSDNTITNGREIKKAIFFYYIYQMKRFSVFYLMIYPFHKLQYSYDDIDNINFQAYLYNQIN